ncbi:hypothetical protein D3C71_1991420 [compost metagenome]
MQIHEAHALCQAHMNKFVRIQMQDGAVYEGVVEKVDHEHVFIACPMRAEEGAADSRYFPYGGWGGPWNPGFGYRRFALPLLGLTTLALLPPFWI